jgi:CRP-like cAMP-binding protein
MGTSHAPATPDVVVHQAARTRDLYLIRSGSVVLRVTDRAAGCVAVGQRAAGDWWGAAALLMDIPQPFTVVAADPCRCCD